MEDLDVLEVGATWSFWDRPVPASIPRRVELPNELSDTLCLVVRGVRRCGKSTLLRQMIGRYGLDPRHCASLNLEDPRLSNALEYPLLERLVRQFRDRHPDTDRLVYFLDEIQLVDGWQRWLRSRLDRPDGSVFVITGSNANLLSGELSTALTGRHLTVGGVPSPPRPSSRSSADPDVGLERWRRCETAPPGDRAAGPRSPRPAALTSCTLM